MSLKASEPSSGVFGIWSEELQYVCQNSKSICVGVFDSDKNLLYANYGMLSVLGVSDRRAAPANFFVNPLLETLFLFSDSDAPVFEGMITVGNMKDINYTLIGTAWRRNNQILIAGEHNIDELQQVNRKMVSLNQEISNLQRSLIKEKVILERTLAELRETQAMLIHSQKMNALGQLVAGVAHEINNPIAFVSSNLHSLGDAFSDIRLAYESMEGLIRASGNPDLREKAAEIRKDHDIDFIFGDFDGLRNASVNGIQRVKKIVEDMRNFSRLDEAELKEVPMLENMQSTISLVQPELKKRRVTIRLDISPSLTVACYPSQFNQAALNIILNAMQAMESGGAIDIKAWEEDNRTCFTFSDTGKGIPPEIMDKIFNPFFTTKPVGQGTGLGLSLVYKIITDMHKGSVQVDSAVNQGTNVMITIPRELLDDNSIR